MVFKRNTPYNELPLLPPNVSAWENIEVFKKLAEARAVLAELKGRTPIIPNPKMLINTLVLQEAKDSSSIENIFTSNDTLFRAFSSTTTKPDMQTKEVLRYRGALWTAWQDLQKNGWSVGLIEDIFRNIKERDCGIRDSEVYVGYRNTVIYTPPCCKTILTEKLQNWIEFAVSANGIDPLIKMAFLHYQFEAIHPFVDGNGRAGRVLNVLYLSYYRLLDQPILYLSKYINENKSDYYTLLREVTEQQNWTGWLLYMIEGVKDTAKYTLEKVNAIYDLFQETIEFVKEKAPKIYSYELVETLFHQPYCKIGHLVEGDIVSRNTASKYLNELEDIGVLSKEQVGNELLYLNTKLFWLMSEY